VSDAKVVLRNHMLAQAMNRQWETLTEIGCALRKETGSRFLRGEVWRLLLELSRDGVHKLEFRHRPQTDFKEYQLHVKPEAIGAGVPTSVFLREYMAKHKMWPGPKRRKA